MTMTTDEIVKLVLKLSRENKKLLGDYTSAMSTMDTAVKKVEESEKKWWVVYKTPGTIGITLVFIFLFVVSLIAVMKSSDMCIVNVSQKDNTFSIQSCKSIKN